MRKLTIIAIAALLGSAPATAQEGHEKHRMPMHGQSMQGMGHCMAMMGGPPPQMLLHHQEALGLSADQVSRLEALRDRAHETAMPHMQPGMHAHMSAVELLEGDSPDFQGYEARIREAADHMVRAHVAMARVAVDARRVLTPEQQARLGKLGGGMMGGEHGKMGAGQAGMDHGAMGGMDHGAMSGMGMMGCMMMGMGTAPDAGAAEHNH